MSEYSANKSACETAIRRNNIDDIIAGMDQTDKDLCNIGSRLADIRKKLIGPWPEPERDKVPACNQPGSGFLDQASNRNSANAQTVREIKEHLAAIEAVTIAVKATVPHD